MKLFPYAHATHPSWRIAVELVLAQLRSLMGSPDYSSTPHLGILYITDHYAQNAREILESLSAELPSVGSWTGTVGVGIASNNVEYFDEPAISVMLCDIDPGSFRIFNGLSPLSGAAKENFQAACALIHADGQTPIDYRARCEHTEPLFIWWTRLKQVRFSAVFPINFNAHC